MSLKKYIEREIATESELNRKISNELKKIPHGTLSATESNGMLYTKVRWSKKEENLGNILKPSDDSERKQKIVSMLTARHCMEEMQNALNYDHDILMKTMQQLRSFDPNELIPRFPKAYRQLTDEIFSLTGFPNYSMPAKMQCDNTFRNNDRIHKTSSGIFVRSRAELAYADNYTARGIFYLYEPEIILPDGTIIHPDFKIFVPGCNRVLFHEHAELFEDIRYRESFLWKERKYIENGLFPNRDLIITTAERDGSIDIEKFNRMLDCFLY